METEVIMKKIINLNKQESLPLYGLRRNSPYYSLISYINNSICLFISGSYDDVALFIKRANEEMRTLTENNVVHKDYFEICDDYLISVSKYIMSRDLLSEVNSKLLPKEYRM